VSRKEIVVVIKQGKGRVIISKKDSKIYGKFSPFCEKKKGGAQVRWSIIFFEKYSKIPKFL